MNNDIQTQIKEQQNICEQAQFKDKLSSYDQTQCQKPPNNYAQTHFMQQPLNNDMQTQFKEQTLNKEEKTQYQNLPNISEQIQLQPQLQNKHDPQLNILQEQMQPNEIYKNHSKSNDYTHNDNSIEVKVSNVQENHWNYSKINQLKLNKNQNNAILEDNFFFIYFFFN